MRLIRFGSKKTIDRMITQQVQYPYLGNNYSGTALSFLFIVNEISFLNF